MRSPKLDLHVIIAISHTSIVQYYSIGEYCEYLKIVHTFREGK